MTSADGTSAQRLLDAMERTLASARRLSDGPVDEGVVDAYLAAREEEADARRAVFDEVGIRARSREMDRVPAMGNRSES